MHCNSEMYTTGSIVVITSNNLPVMVSVETDCLLVIKSLDSSSRDLYTLYEMLRPPGFSSGGSQVIVIESSDLATTRRFLGGDGSTATMTLPY